MVIFHSSVNVYRRVSQGISATAVGSVDSVDSDRGATGPSLAIFMDGIIAFPPGNCGYLRWWKRSETVKKGHFFERSKVWLEGCHHHSSTKCVHISNVEGVTVHDIDPCFFFRMVLSEHFPIPKSQILHYFVIPHFQTHQNMLVISPK